LNQTNRIDQTNQTNKINQTNQRDQIDQRGDESIKMLGAPAHTRRD
jgi:hypothetical protein